ncbi:MAG: hypothetical protein QM802_06335 [Agriterribacter sp.]
MQVKKWKIATVVGCIFIIQACNNSEPHVQASFSNDSAAAIKLSRSLPICGATEVKDTSMSDMAAEKAIRHLNAADEQYLAMVIPDYSEIDLLYENCEEALAYTTELKQYFIGKHCSINRFRTMDAVNNVEQKEKRFYIKHIGDNRYFIYVYRTYIYEMHS